MLERPYLPVPTEAEWHSRKKSLPVMPSPLYSYTPRELYSIILSTDRVALG